MRKLSIDVQLIVEAYDANWDLCEGDIEEHLRTKPFEVVYYPSMNYRPAIKLILRPPEVKEISSTQPSVIK